MAMRPGTGAGGGANDHALLANRGAPAQHPTSAISGLDTEQAAQDSATEAETQARQDSDTALQNMVNAETEAREDADAELQLAAETEIRARQVSDATLQAAVNAETGAREDADAELQLAVETEIQARQVSAAMLQAAVNAETQAREDADAALEGAIGGKQDSLSANVLAALNAANAPGWSNPAATMEDVKNSGLAIGFVFQWASTQLPPNSLRLNGALLNRAAYPDLWAFASASGLILNETAWQTAAAAGASVKQFSSGNGSTTFRLPKIVEYRLTGKWTAPVAGNGMTLGLTDNVLPVGLSGSNSVGFQGQSSAYGQPAGSAIVNSTDQSAKNYGVTTDPAKSGIAADLSQVITDGYNWYIKAF